MDRAGSGIRRLTGLLLLLNLGVLAAGLGISYWPSQPVTTLEFNGDKVKFQREPEGNGVTNGPTNGLAGSATANNDKAAAFVAAQPGQAPEVADRKPAAPACLSWRSLDADGLMAVESRLKQAGMAPGSYDIQLSKHLGWWVFLPPFADTDAVRAAMEDARGKGVTDMAPVRGGKMANALSLGAFATLEGARSHAATLAGKGIKGVRLGPRPEAGEVRLVLSGKGPQLSAESLLKDWPQGLQPAVCSPGTP